MDIQCGHSAWTWSTDMQRVWTCSMCGMQHVWTCNMDTKHEHLACPWCTSMLLVHEACPCCMSMLYVHTVYVLYSMSLVYVLAASPCNIPAACSCPCCLSNLHTHAACIFSMSLLHGHMACPCCMSILYVRVLYLCFMPMLNGPATVPGLETDRWKCCNCIIPESCSALIFFLFVCMCLLLVLTKCQHPMT